MRFLRMLTNAVLAGLLAGVYVAIVFLQVNPHLPLDLIRLLPLLSVVVGFYALVATAFFYTVIVGRQLLVSEPLSPGWLSLRLLSWSSTAAAAAAGVLMWLNLRGLDTALAEESARRLGFGALATGLSAIALLAIAVVHYSFGRRGGAVGASLFMLAVLASVTLPLVARGPATPRSLGAYPLDVGSWSVPIGGASRVVMLLLDGASLDYISVATAEGRLPNFGRVLDSGAAMHLATLRPTQPGPVWTTVATGQYPPRHGVVSTATYHAGGDLPPLDVLPDYCFAQALVFFGVLEGTPASSASIRARPIWSVLSGQGVPVGIVGWPLTYPVQPVRGFVVSDRFHEITGPGEDPEALATVYPEEALTVGADVVRQAGERTGGEVLADEEGTVVTTATGAPIWRDQVYRRIGEALWTRFDEVRLLAVRYRGLDLAGHRFLPGGTPVPLPGLDGARGDAASLEEYYRYVDGAVGEALDLLGPNDLLLVVSGFGMEPVGLTKQLLGRVVGDPLQTGTHENAPDGFLLAYGAVVEPGRLPRGSVADVAPTILYYLGVPVARDVAGLARTDVFRDDFTRERPITFVPSYDR